MGITWSEMMSVGVPALDADHRTLIGLVNALNRSIGDVEEFAALGTVLAALCEYTEHHFAREETVLEACHYPQCDVHRSVHAKLAAEVARMKADYDQDPTVVRARDCLNFLHRWLIDHICSADMDYRAWVVGHAAALTAPDQVSMINQKGATSSLDWRRIKVLVVDDNHNFCQVLRTILEGVGVTDIATVHGLDTARAALAGTRFDLVLSDWHVGTESGLDFVRWMRGRAATADLPVLMLSGHERLASRDVALAAGADEFMEKPISARGMLICLARMLTRIQASS